MKKIEKYALAFMILWALIVLLLYGLELYHEVPYDERQRAKTDIEGALLHNDEETVSLKSHDVRRLVELADVYILSFLFHLTSHVITAAIMLIMAGFILVSRLINKKSKKL
jgi:hypothetical protein